MANLIDQLRAEHVGMAKILRVLEAELDKFGTAETPDYDLIWCTSDYFLDYPEACHHPKEDAVYRSLVASRPVATGSVLDIEAEHITTSKLARKFARAVQDWGSNKDESQASFIEVARQFIEAQRQHMNTEEAKLFPMALDALTDDDWAAIDTRIVSKKDPVFGSIPDERFNALREMILAWEPAEDVESISA